MKEVQAPKGYVRNTDDVYTFAFSYTNDKEAKQTFKHTFKNERVTAKISLQKQVHESNAKKNNRSCFIIICQQLTHNQTSPFVNNA